MKLRRLDDIIIHSLHVSGQTALRWQDNLNLVNPSKTEGINKINYYAEEEFIETIKKYYPEDEIIPDSSHHEGIRQALKDPAQPFDLEQRIWTIDPIDGLSNFRKNSKIWASCLALLSSGKDFQAAAKSTNAVIASAIYQPALKKIYIQDDRRSGLYLIRGDKNQLDKITDWSPSDCKSLNEAVLGSFFPKEWTDKEKNSEKFLKILDSSNTVRIFGSGSLDMAKVAIGKLDAWVNFHVNPWHWLPGANLVEVAGGTTIEEGEWRIAAATKELADEILAIIKS